MAISNVSTANQPSAIKPTAASNPVSAAGKGLPYGEQQPAAIVTLSAQAKRLSVEQPAPRTQTETRANQPEQVPRTQAQTRTSQTQSALQLDKVAVTKVETGAREAAEAPSTRQQDETVVAERKRINTYA